MLILIGVGLFVLVGVILSAIDRFEIESRQQELQASVEKLELSLKKEREERKKEYLKHIGEQEV